MVNSEWGRPAGEALFAVRYSPLAICAFFCSIIAVDGAKSQQKISLPSHCEDTKSNLAATNATDD
jgi:hypothetical protein